MLCPSLSIPLIADFKPEYRETHQFRVAYVFDDEALGTTTAAYPDDDGRIDVEIPLGRMLSHPGNTAEVEVHAMAYSIHGQTAQLLLTMDLPDIPLRQLLSVLHTVIRNGGTVNNWPFTYGSSISSQDAAFRLSLRGENMTLRETFDLIYQQTSCDVFREQDQLLVGECH